MIFDVCIIELCKIMFHCLGYHDLALASHCSMGGGGGCGTRSRWNAIRYLDPPKK